MNNSWRPFSLLMAAALALSSISVCGQLGRFYVRGDAGGTLTSDTDLREFFGPVTSGSKVTFDPGFRFGFAFGYEVTDFFSAEGQTGFMWNNIESITDGSVHDAFFENVPFLGNVRFQLPRTRFTPYIGGGVGFSTSIIDVDEIQYNGIFMHGSEADTVFAYQGFGGFLYRINPQMSVSVEYRYFHAEPPEWHVDSTFNTFSNRLKFGETQTHSLSLTFAWNF